MEEDWTKVEHFFVLKMRKEGKRIQSALGGNTVHYIYNKKHRAFFIRRAKQLGLNVSRTRSSSTKHMVFTSKCPGVLCDCRWCVFGRPVKEGSWQNLTTNLLIK